MLAPMDLLAAAVFAVASSITPGPNVLMVAAASASGGLRAALPMMLGISVGFPAMLVALGLGLAVPVQASAQVRGLLSMAAFLWIVWLAFRIATAPMPGEAEARPPMGFLGAAGFQWVNPKAWLIAVAALGAFVPPGADMVAGSLVLALLFAAVSLPCLLVWAWFGAALRRVLSSPRAFRAFSVAMGALLAASVLPMLRPPA
ncbi:MAG: LysE family translocator [Acetobacteraceae bacterium]|nr:LysE family translocator [Acetobacteraceae bacterium]